MLLSMLEFMLANFQTFNILKIYVYFTSLKLQMTMLANTRVVGLTNWETIGNNTENSIGNIVMEQKLEIRNFLSSPP
jgi:hypothetical protein